MYLGKLYKKDVPKYASPADKQIILICRLRVLLLVI